MGMRAAALEINHWCHEKVNYRGTCRPDLSRFAIDSKRELEHAFSEIMGKEVKYSLPVVCFCTDKGHISMINLGYRIGTGETLWQHIKSSEKIR